MLTLYMQGYPLSGDMILLGEFTFLVAGGFPVQTFQIQKVRAFPMRLKPT
jgi:hypothetical protein